MIEVKGKFNKAKIFTDKIESQAIGQVIELCNQEFSEGTDIRIMPDAHYGAGCTIGTTITVRDKIVPNLVGLDIGCGMEVVVLNKHKNDIDFEKLDEVIRNKVPSGFNINHQLYTHSFNSMIAYDLVKAPFNQSRAERSLGTLGGGNHFIELNEGADGFVYLVIHSGSRSFGGSIAKHYQDLAHETLSNKKDERQKIISDLKAQGRHHKIQAALKGVKPNKVPKHFAYLEGEQMYDYINDMTIAQDYARLNRKAMASVILNEMDWDFIDNFTTVHNYYDVKNDIIRKGAISAQEGERVIIPINMRDGSIIAYGKGNPDWNYSGPHGAGRVMSRTKAKENIDFDEFKESMEGVWTSSVVQSTLDEAPMAYKSIEDIIDYIGDSVEIHQVIKPLYNFKAN